MSTAQIGALRVVLGLDSAAFTEGLSAAQKHLRGVGRQMQQVGQTMATVGAGMTAAITAPLIAAGFAASKAATEAADAMGQVKASLESMGGASGRTADELGKMADSLMRASTFDDDDILRNVTANLLTFGKVSEEQFDRAQQAIVDYATKAKVDLKAATIQIGKALQDPIKGMTALGKAGIQFSDSQKAAIRAMVAAGDVAGAQRIILGELETQFKGSAKAAQDTDPYDRLRDALSSLSETAGDIINRVLTPFIEKLAKLAEHFNNMSPQAQNFAIAATAIAAAAGPVLIALGGLVQALGFLAPLMAPVVALLGAISAPVWIAIGAAVAVAVGAFVLFRDEIGEALSHVWKVAKEALGPAFRDLFTLIGEHAASIGQTFSEIMDSKFMKVLSALSVAFAKVFGETIVRTLAVAIHAISGGLRMIGNVLSILGDVLTGDFSGAMEGMKRLATDAAESLKSIWRALGPAVQRYVREMVEGVTRWLVDKLGQVMDWVGKKAEQVGDAFHRLYIRVVGNSYVPDMVRETGEWFAQLQRVMVDPAVRATQQTGDAFEAMRDRLRGILDELMTDRERALLEFDRRQLGLDDSVKAGLLSPEMAAEMSRRNRARRDSALFDAAAPERAYFGTAMAGMRDLMGNVRGAGGDTWATAREAMADAADSVSRAMEDVKSGLDEAGDRFAHNFARTFEGLIRGDVRGVLEEVLTSVLRGTLLNIGRMIHGWGSQQSGVIGSIFGMLPGFATGGSFRVGGAGGIDSKLVAFRATPGEMVDVRRPGQDRGSGGALHFDLRGAVMTRDLLAQMQRMATESGGMAYGAARSTIPAEKARRDRFAYGAG